MIASINNMRVIILATIATYVKFKFPSICIIEGCIYFINKTPNTPHAIEFNKQILPL